MTFDKQANLEQAAASIIEGNDSKAREVADEALAAGVPAGEFLDEGLIPGMDVVGTRFRDGDMFLPEVLLAARAMKSAMEVLQPELARAGSGGRGKVIIGTVVGDVHDIGKNIVVAMLEGAGFQVIDLGTNVSPETFAAQVLEHQPQILCMSALLTTTMPAMQETIKRLQENKMRERVKVIIGGAPVTASFAQEIDSDAYAEDASATVAFCKQFLNSSDN